VAWFDEYLDFESGRAPGQLLQHFPADVWVVHLGLTQLHEWFRKSPDWSPRFVGRSAVVFVRRRQNTEAVPVEFTAHLEDIRNLQQALLLMQFALDVDRYDVARHIVEGLERSADHRQSPWTFRSRRLLDGLQAANDGARAQAVKWLSEIEPFFKGRASTTLSEVASAEAATLWQQDRWSEAINYALQARAVTPQSPFIRYNVAVMAWWSERQTAVPSGVPWRQELDTLIEMPGVSDPSWPRGMQQARAILSDLQTTKPQVYVSR
jgi:hypothetical protein